MLRYIFCCILAAAAAPLLLRYCLRYSQRTLAPKQKRLLFAFLLAACAALGCASLFVKNSLPGGMITALLCAAVVGIAVTDALCMEIPPLLNIVVLVCSLALLWLDRSRWQSHLLAVAVGGGFVLLLFLCSKGKAFSFGDVKLVAAAAVGLTLPGALLALLVAFPLAAVVQGMRILLLGKEHRFAFGPYLCAGIVFANLFGERVLSWYASLFPALRW